MNTQVELWQAIPDLDIVKCSGNAKRAGEFDELHERASCKFSDTLTDETQKKAFDSLRTIAEVMRWEWYHAGIAAGMQLANEFREFSANPLKAYTQDTARLTAESFIADELENITAFLGDIVTNQQ